MEGDEGKMPLMRLVWLQKISRDHNCDGFSDE